MIGVFYQSKRSIINIQSEEGKIFGLEEEI